MLQEYKIQSGLTLHDVACKLLGGLDNIVKLLQQNTFLESLNANLEDFITQDIIYDTDWIQKPAPQITLPSAPVDMNKYSGIGLNGQNIYDACLRAYGSIDKVVQLMLDSAIVSINEQDVSFKNLNFNQSHIIDETLVNVFNKRQTVYSTLAPVAQSIIDKFRLADDLTERIINTGQNRIIN